MEAAKGADLEGPHRLMSSGRLAKALRSIGFTQDSKARRVNGAVMRLWWSNNTEAEIFAGREISDPWPR